MHTDEVIPEVSEDCNSEEPKSEQEQSELSVCASLEKNYKPERLHLEIVLQVEGSVYTAACTRVFTLEIAHEGELGIDRTSVCSPASELEKLKLQEVRLSEERARFEKEKEELEKERFLFESDQRFFAQALSMSGILLSITFLRWRF